MLKNNNNRARMRRRILYDCLYNSKGAQRPIDCPLYRRVGWRRRRPSGSAARVLVVLVGLLLCRLCRMTPRDNESRSIFFVGADELRKSSANQQQQRGGGTGLPTSSTMASSTTITTAAESDTDSSTSKSIKNKEDSSSTTTTTPTTTSSLKFTKRATLQEQFFMKWCHDELGIQTMLEIAHFTYDAAVWKVNTTNALEDDLLLSNDTKSTTTSDAAASAATTILVRGLAAKEDIRPGDVVIRIPLNALIVRDTLADLALFVLSESNKTMPWYRSVVLDHAERHHHQWIFDPTVLSVQSETFRIMARNLRDEMNSLYEEYWPAGTTSSDTTNHNHNPSMDDTSRPNNNSTKLPSPSPPSFEEFAWAFQLVNSRHWRVPFPVYEDQNVVPPHASHEQPPPPLVDSMMDATPPANIPTQAWVLQEEDNLATTTTTTTATLLSSDVDDDTVVLLQQQQQQQMNDKNAANGTTTTSMMMKPFLAPVADLLNLGVPCTRVRTDHMGYFELVSTCHVEKGHQMTFWYGDDLCADAILAVYGMTVQSERIAPCKTVLEWKQRTLLLEERLKDAVQDIEILEKELEEVEGMLLDCCGGDHQDSHPRFSDDTAVVESADESEGSSLRRRGTMGSRTTGRTQQRYNAKNYDDEEF